MEQQLYNLEDDEFTYTTHQWYNKTKQNY